MYYLVVLDGGEAGQKIPLEEGENIMGRAEEAHIRITDPKASAKHCKIILEGERITITDLRSRNGTFVNGASRQMLELRIGDRIVIGTFVFELRRDAQ